MTSIEEKKKQILANETKLANRIAREVLQKPELSLWMILIPIIFVYYFYSFNRYTTAKKEFVRHFLLSRQKILEEACSMAIDKREPDYPAMAKKENIPDGALDGYQEWAKVLLEHYTKLMDADGQDFKSLVKNRYENRGRYLLILDQLSKVEIRFYEALRKSIADSAGGSIEVIKTMEKCLPFLRRLEADEIFPQSATPR